MLAVAYELSVRISVFAIPRFYEAKNSRVRIPGQRIGDQMDR
jgi:hypothetical protein